jgi:endonuclease/exonuclease/phosphatase family metal-dependent hydrolase
MKYIKITALIFGAMFAVVSIWYAVSRIRGLNTPLAIYSAGATAERQSGYKTDALKVASYNIAHGRGGKYGAKNWSHKTKEALLKHLDSIAEQIKAEDPDIIVLNETDFSSAWSFNIDQAAYIGKKCGYAHILEQKNMVVSFPFYHLSFGNAILSRHPIRNERFIRWPRYSSLEDIFAGSHNGFYCELQLPSGPIGILGIHLEYRSEAIRVRCAEMIAELSAATDLPVLALGDFNSTPAGWPKAGFSDAGKNAMSYLLDEHGFVACLNETKNLTFPSEKPDRRIDWIIGQRIGSFSNSKIIQSHLSDHLMIVSEIELPSMLH